MTAYFVCFIWQCVSLLWRRILQNVKEKIFERVGKRSVLSVHYSTFWWSWQERGQICIKLVVGRWQRVVFFLILSVDTIRMSADSLIVFENFLIVFGISHQENKILQGENNFFRWGISILCRRCGFCPISIVLRDCVIFAYRRRILILLRFSWL